MNVLYLYSGSRKDKFHGKISVDYPDTQFYGLNHLSRFAVSAEYKELSDLPMGSLLNKVLNFRIKHLLLFWFVRGRDIVFGSSILYLVILKKIFRTRTKFILLNIGITRTLSANKNKKIKFGIISWLLGGLDGIVCLANIQREYLETNYPFLKGRIFFVPLGVDINYYKASYENRKDYILSVGRDNGRDYRTVMEVARTKPEENFEIVCSRRNLSGIDKIPANVTVFYDLSFTELNKKYHEAKMLLLLTHDDSYLDGADCSGQTVLLDAMASGLPVIASRKKYLEDYARNEEEVLFVNFYDASNIAAAINVINNTNTRQKLAVAARNRVEKEFSTEKMAEKLSAIFKKINEKN